MNRLGRIPFVPAMNQRGLVNPSPTDGKDQRVVGAVITPVPNSVMNSASYYAEKRPGFATLTTPSAGNAGTAVFVSTSTNAIISAFGLTNSTIFEGTVNAGTITGFVSYISQTIISGTTIYLLPSSDGTGWFLAQDATSQTAYTVDTHTNTTVDGIASTAGMYVGQAVTGSGFQAGTRIAQVNSGTAITLTLATTTSLSGTTLTKTPVAKIIDSDFPSITGPMVEMSGYVFVLTSTTSRLHQSNLNSVTAWTAGEFITANLNSDYGYALARVKNQILALGSNGGQWFYNAGNPTGSVLSATSQAVSKAGLLSATLHALAKCGDLVAWWGNEEGATAGIYMMDGFTPTRISTPTIETILQSVTSNFYVYAYTLGGQKYVYVSNATIHLVYSTQTKRWSEAGFSTLMIFADVGKDLSGVAVAVDTTTAGKVYSIGKGSDYQDAGVAYTMTIQFSDQAFGDGRATIYSMVELIADNQASGTTSIEYSDDDGVTWSTARTLDMTSKQKRLWRLGKANGHRMWRITHSSNTAWRGQFLDIYGEKAAA